MHTTGVDAAVGPRTAGSRYQLPHPNRPEDIGFSPRDLAYNRAFMVGAGAIDGRIDNNKKRKECAKGQVPIYEFCTNDGFVATATEAAPIAEAIGRQDVFAVKFLTARDPRSDPANDDQHGRTREPVAFGIAFSRVAAADNGYTIRRVFFGAGRRRR